MYNQILKIINNKSLQEENRWALFVENNFTKEQKYTLDFIIESFPENLILSNGIPNPDILSIIALMAYDIGGSREIIKNLKYSKDLEYLYSRIVDSSSTKYSSRDNIINPKVGDTVYEDNKLYRYSAYTWDSGENCPDSPPESPSMGDYWYDKDNNIVYTFNGAEWVEKPGVSKKEQENPYYGDTWLDIKNSILYTYNTTYWEEINLTENNLKLLLPLLEDMKFFLLSTTDDFSLKENIVKNFRNLAEDSFSFIKNYGTLPTLKRLINDYLFDAVGREYRVPFTVDALTTPGVISIDIPELVDKGLVDLVDQEKSSGSSPEYTFELNKDSLLYRYLMRLKPAGIVYDMISTLNSSILITVMPPEVSILSVDYDNKTYTLSIKNTNSFPVSMSIVDKRNAAGVEYGIPEVYPSLKANEYIVITRAADNQQFEVSTPDPVTTDIKVTVSYGASSDYTEVSHIANAVLSFTENDLVLTKISDSSGYNGYAEVKIYNTNNRAVKAYINYKWDNDDPSYIIRNISANSGITLLYYNNDYNTNKNFTYTAYLVDSLGSFVNSLTDTDTLYDIPGKPRLSISLENLTLTNVVKLDGGYVGVSIDNTNNRKVNAKVNIKWRSVSTGLSLGEYNYNIVINSLSNVVQEFKNSFEKSEATVTVYLEDYDVYFNSSDSIVNTATIDGRALSLLTSDLLVSKSGYFINVTMKNNNSVEVVAELTVNWAEGSSTSYTYNIPAKVSSTIPSILETFENTTGEITDVSVSLVLYDNSGNYTQSILRNVILQNVDSDSTVKVASPSIVSTGFREISGPLGSFTQFYWKVKNNDTRTVTIYSQIGNSDPTDNPRSISPGQTSDEITYTTNLIAPDIVVSAKATYPSAPDSTIVSVMIPGNMV